MRVEGVVAHRRRLMMDCISSSCASQDFHLTTESSGSFGPAACCSEAHLFCGHVTKNVRKGGGW